MPLTETLNFGVGTLLFVRSLFDAIFTENKDTPVPCKEEPVKGTGLHQALPEKLPSIVEIKNVIPRHCFKSVVHLSLYYAVRDCVQVVVAYLILSCLSMWVTSNLIHTFLVVLYWAV